MNVEPGVDAGEMVSNGALADEHRFSDRLYAFTLGQPAEGLPLPTRQAAKLRVIAGGRQSSDVFKNPSCTKLGSDVTKAKLKLDQALIRTPRHTRHLDEGERKAIGSVTRQGRQENTSVDPRPAAVLETNAVRRVGSLEALWIVGHAPPVV